MGKPSATGDDLAFNVVTATLSAAGQATAWQAFTGSFNVFIGGTFVATLIPEVSFDGGATALQLTSLGSAIQFTGRVAEQLSNAESGLLFRIRCSAHTSGAAEVRLSQ
ncbi:MAG: hypothetical protein SNJ79_05950 [Sphingomonadaceae bacterium]